MSTALCSVLVKCTSLAVHGEAYVCAHVCVCVCVYRRAAREKAEEEARVKAEKLKAMQERLAAYQAQWQGTQQQ